MQFTFDKRTRRFRDDKSGKFVSQETLRRELTKTSDIFRRDASRLADKLNKGKLSKAKWATEMRTLIKDNLILTASVGKGGRKQMSFSDWGKTGADIKREYRYFKGFADAVKRLSPAQINARARLYADAGHVAFSNGVTATHIEGGFTHAKRSLHAAESCSGCIAEAGEWMPIEDIEEIGSVSPCFSRCRCSISFR